MDPIVFYPLKTFALENEMSCNMFKGTVDLEPSFLTSLSLTSLSQTGNNPYPAYVTCILPNSNKGASAGILYSL